MKLREWNASVEYAVMTCDNLKKKGYNVKPASYTMHDGRKGIYLQLFDNQSILFEQYSSGIHDNLEDMKKSIEYLAKRIVNDN